MSSPTNNQGARLAPFGFQVLELLPGVFILDNEGWPEPCEDEALANERAAARDKKFPELAPHRVVRLLAVLKANAPEGCDYWKPIADGGIALPCSCGKNCDSARDDAPEVDRG